MNETTGRDFWDGAISMTPAAHKLHNAADITSPFANNPLELTVFVWCCNDESSIIPTLESVVEAMDVAGVKYEILIVDDASKDKSTELIRGFMAQYPNLNIVMRINKTRKGLAQNYFDGAFIGCGKYYRLVRGDNSEPVEMMVDIFKSTGDADIVVPYYVSRLKQGALYSFSTALFNMFANLMTGNQINTYSTTPMHLRYNVMRWHSEMRGDAFQMDLLCRLLAMDFTCKQVPCRTAYQQTNPKGSRFLRSLSTFHCLLNIVFRALSAKLNNK